MEVLSNYRLAEVFGGDHWGREGGDDEDMANSYQNSNGSWGSPGGQTATAQNFALATARSGEVLSACYTVQIGPVTSQTCTNSDGSKTVQNCVNVGPSVSVAGMGFGAQGNICSTRTVQH